MIFSYAITKIISEDYLIFNLDEAIIFSNDTKMMSWSKVGTKASICFKNRYNFHKLTLYAVVTSQGKLYY